MVADAALEAFERVWGEENTDTKPTLQRVLMPGVKRIGRGLVRVTPFDLAGRIDRKLVLAGNPDGAAFHSTAHGAGRVQSRHQAARSVSDLGRPN